MQSEIAIDPNFSVYDLVERVQKDSTLLNHRRTMSIISNEIENASLIDQTQTSIFSGFQRMSKFIPQIERYRQMANTATHIYVFGVEDVILPPIKNITYVPLEKSDKLAREWFLVSYGKEYFSALATEELTRFEDPDHTRKFKGIWTFDLTIVTILYDWLAGTVGERTLALNPDTQNLQRQEQLKSNTMARLLMRIINNERETPIILDQLKTIFEQNSDD